MDNKIMLITYPDSLGSNLVELYDILQRQMEGAVYSVHILPFFPSSGDRGFAPLRYDQVDEPFGSWQDIRRLANRYPLMFDYMINHISAQSPYYKDFLEKKDNSPYAGLFIRYKDFWPQGEPTHEQVGIIYKRKPRAPYAVSTFADGSTEKVWCTFGEEQIDLANDTDAACAFLENNLRMLAQNGAAMLRMDAFAYATKKVGTNCFFVEPQVWNLLKRCADIASVYGAEILPEIHEHYTIQKRIADKGYYVYDFALPMLVLNALYFGQSKYLSRWLDMCPRKQFTTLDTHDGIGVVDVVGLLPENEIEATKEHLFRYGANVKKIYNTEAYNNLDIYQVNCTYYSALGDDDDSYLLARSIQFFTPGIPQVYYVGMLAGRNDLQLLEATKEGRNINRHYYSVGEIEDAVQRPIVCRLLELMRLRNRCTAFNGDFMHSAEGSKLLMRWTTTECSIELQADLESKSFVICQQMNGQSTVLMRNGGAL